MTATGIRMTADELLRLPDNGKRYELIAGELHEMAPAWGEHGIVALEAAYRLRAFLEHHPEAGGKLFAAETGFRLTRIPDTVRAPDVAYVGAARLHQARVPGFPELAPDLIVEVVSPNDTASEIQKKVAEWLRAGTQLVWVIYPATRSAVAHRPGEAEQLLHADDSLRGDPVLPGFSCRLGDLF